MNVRLLKKVAGALQKNHYSLMDSKWQNSECEVLVTQTIVACCNNNAKHDDAFSWLGESATHGRAQCGTDNGAGLRRLLNDGSIIQEAYTGSLIAPKGTAMEKGVPQILRVTDELLTYAASHMRLKVKVV